MRATALHLHVAGIGAGLLKEEVIIAGEDGPCNIEHVLEVEGLFSGHVGVHGDEAFLEGLLVIRVESVPEKGVALFYSYPTCAEEDLALSIELVLVVDDVSFVLHAFLGILAGEVDKLLSRKLAFRGGAKVLDAELLAEVVPVVVDEPWQILPDMTLGVVDVLNNHFHLLPA